MNVNKIITIVREINLQYNNVVPMVCYLADIQALNDADPSERKRGIENNTAIIKSGIIDELWMFGEWWNSKGCLAEIELASSLSIPVVYKTQKP